MTNTLSFYFLMIGMGLHLSVSFHSFISFHSFQSYPLSKPFYSYKFKEYTIQGYRSPSKIDISMSTTPNTGTRRKMGPPLRKQFSEDPSQQQLVGRVTVYCVGGGLDLQGLRAHVFRRGFSGSISKYTTIQSNDQAGSNDPATIINQVTDLQSNQVRDLSNLMLSRSITSEKAVEDEVLHVTNSPLLTSLNFGNDLSMFAMNNEITASGTSTININSNSNNMNSNSNINGNSNNLGSKGRSLDVNMSMDEEDMEAEEVRRNMLLFRATQDIFYFDYGCVVFWGLSPQEERAALTELVPFTIESTSTDELKNSYDTMEYIYDRKANPQRPIRFDRMKVRSLNIEEKLALSYGMAQSSKLFVLESRVLQSIEMTRYLPKDLSIDGKIKLSKKDINRLIGKLFVEQTEVNLFSSILDTPDFLWDNDEHLPTYEYIRSYLEVDDRVQLLNSRLSVIRELLDVLNAQVAHNNSERLEWIIIWLISVEIVLGIFSNPLFVGKRLVSAMLVPTAILLFKRAN